jgi:hypothetical protein
MTSGRLFSPEEASAMLPTLRRLVGRLREAKRELDRESAELEALLERSAGNGHGLGQEVARRRASVANLAAEIEDLLSEVQDLGCEVKGVDEGLIDFRSWREGRVVYLCWRLGEDAIRFWHELDTGFAGRQPL